MQEEMHYITEKMAAEFAAALGQREYSRGTVENYLRSLRRFAAWSGGAASRSLAAGWKAFLAGRCAPATVNAMLAGINCFFAWGGWEECRVKPLRLQRRSFQDPERELSREGYRRLVQTARAQGRERLALLMETLCATGIRVGELKYITVEAVRAGVAEIALKGKIRTILLPHRLCRKLQKYAKQQKIASGKLFLTQDGLPVSRQSIWTRMKALCQAAGVERSKAFPHNLRSLFARSFYGFCQDVVRLAAVLGHSRHEQHSRYNSFTGNG